MRTTLSPVPAIPRIHEPTAAQSAAQPGVFQKLLENSIHRVESLRQDATTATTQFLAGNQEDLHTVALATQRAELAFDLFLQVRNKVVQAYQDIMRMQL